MLQKDDFKNCLARFASGVTVVTYKDGEEMGGITVSSFTSLSMDPPLVLFNLNRASHSHSVIQSGKGFAIHILSADQEEISNGFASSKVNKHEFLHSIGYDLDGDVPIFGDCLAVLLCEKEVIYDGGDHSIVVARVKTTRVREGLAPLLYYNRGYHRLP